MPIIQSAIKRVRQQEKRRARNAAAKRRIKTASKETLAQISAKDIKAAQTSLLKAISQIDKAIKKGTLHKNTGARRKSQLVRSYNAASDKAFGTEASNKPKTAAKKPATKKASAKTTKAAPKKPASKK